METRTEHQMAKLILDFARADDRVRIVAMNGSRADPHARRDIFQDYDIACFVTEVEPFRDEKPILSHFGPAILIQKPEEHAWPPPVGDGRYNYNMLLADGNRIDLSFFALEQLAERITDSLTRLLLDKDGLVPDLPPPSARDSFTRPPTRKLYEDCCNEFFFGLGAHVPKTIWRRQLPLFKHYVEIVLRRPLLLMFAWEIAGRSDFEISIGKGGKHLRHHLDPDSWGDYERTHTGADWDQAWESLFIFHRLFKQSAGAVARRHRFRFPEADSARVLAFLEHVRTLPPDAAALF